MKDMKVGMIWSVALVFLLGSVSAISADDKTGADRRKLDAEAAKALAEAYDISVNALAKKAKAEADAVKSLAEATNLISESHLNEAKRALIEAEIQRLFQVMRITEYEFQRIARADYRMELDIARIEYNIELIKPLYFGRATWQTWVGLDNLLQLSGDPELISTVMFNTKVPPLAEDEFLSNAAYPETKAFPGGNLGQLYLFARKNGLSFAPYREAHGFVMKILAFISKAAEMRIEKARQVNQSVRLTIANLVK